MKPCNDCPFKVSSGFEGAPDWLEDVMKAHRAGNLSHSCHKTDPEADGFAGAPIKRECVGLLTIEMNDYDGTPGKDGVWISIMDMAKAYLKHWHSIGWVKDERIARLK